MTHLRVSAWRLHSRSCLNRSRGGPDCRLLHPVDRCTQHHCRFGRFVHVLVRQDPGVFVDFFEERVTNLRKARRRNCHKLKLHGDNFRRLHPHACQQSKGVPGKSQVTVELQQLGDDFGRYSYAGGKILCHVHLGETLEREQPRIGKGARPT